jgi:hypothetical protein
MIAGAYADTAKLSRGRRHQTERRDNAERLYALNRGALRQEGILLPAELVVDIYGESLPASPAHIERALRKALPKIGVEPVPADYSPRFTLTITVTGREGRCTLYDGGRGSTIWERTIPLLNLTPKELTTFTRTLAETAFTVR